MKSLDQSNLKRHSNSGRLLYDPATGSLVRSVEVVVAASSHTDTCGYGGRGGKTYSTKTFYPDGTGDAAYSFPVDCDEKNGTYVSEDAYEAACVEEYVSHPGRYNSGALRAALSDAPSGWYSGSALATGAPAFSIWSRTRYEREEYVDEDGETKTRNVPYRYRLARLSIRFDAAMWCVQPRSSLFKSQWGWRDEDAARYIAIAGYTSMDISLDVGFSARDGRGARAVVALAGTGESMPSSFASAVSGMDGGTLRKLSFPASGSSTGTASFTGLPVASYAWGYLFVEDLSSRSIYNTVSIGAATVTYRR